MSLRNARGNKAYYDYAPHKGSWPAWERRQRILQIGLAILALIICLGIIIVFTVSAR